MSDYEKEWSSVYQTVTQIARAELETSSGEQLLNSLIGSNKLADFESAPFPPAIYDPNRIALLINEATEEMDKIWGSTEFAKATAKNPDVLLVNMETGDFPELIQAGYPYLDGNGFSYGLLEKLAAETFFRLDDFLTICTGRKFDELKHFWFADLSYCNLGESIPKWHDTEQRGGQKRTLLGSIAIIAAIRSHRSCELDSLPSNLWFSISEGCQVFGALTCVQANGTT